MIEDEKNNIKVEKDGEVRGYGGWKRYLRKEKVNGEKIEFEEIG